MSTRTRILEAAKALFAEQGYDGVSMREIAAAAGLQPASLYNHFAGKSELFLAVVEQLLAEKRKRLIDPISPDLSPVVQLRLFTEALAGFMAETAAHARLPLWIMLQAGQDQQLAIVQRLWREEFEWVLMRMRQCVADEQQALTLTLQLFGLTLFEFAARSLIDQLPVNDIPSPDPRAVAARVWHAVTYQMEHHP